MVLWAIFSDIPCSVESERFNVPTSGGIFVSRVEANRCGQEFCEAIDLNFSDEDNNGMECMEDDEENEEDRDCDSVEDFVG